jgi:hypothetical protein
MSRTASRLRQQQLLLARRLKNAELGRTHVEPLDLLRDGLLLASLTLDLDAGLCSGLPFPTVWILPASMRHPVKPEPTSNQS